MALSPGQRITREKLCGLLWGGRGDEQARSSLRQSMTALRRELGGDEDRLFSRHDDVLALRTETLSIDLLELDRPAAAGGGANLRRAVELCRGELLSDLALREEGFEEWLAAEKRKAADKVIRLHEALAQSESGAAAVDVARRLLALDPLRETSHRLLIEALAAAGEKALALKQYEACERLLRSEFGVAPAPETLQLKTEIARDRPAAAVPALSSFLPTG